MRPVKAAPAAKPGKKMSVFSFYKKMPCIFRINPGFECLYPNCQLYYKMSYTKKVKQVLIPLYLLYLFLILGNSLHNPLCPDFLHGQQSPVQFFV